MKPELLEKIKLIIAEEFGILPEMLIGPRNSDYVSTARHVLNLTLYNLGLSLVAVGKTVGKDHTTIIHSKRVYYDLYKTDPFFKFRAEQVELRVAIEIFGAHNKKP